MKNSTLLTKNKVGTITAEDQKQVDDYLETARAFARITYSSVYVIDYATLSFDYVSENPLFLSGFTPEEVMQMGYEFYFKCVPENDLRLLEILNEEGFDFFEKLPAGEKKQYHISYDFHLVNAEGKAVLINHKLTPLFLTSEGRMWKAMCVVSLSYRQEAGNVTIYKQGSNELWTLDTSLRIWRRSVKASLTEKEMDVLRLYAQGYTIGQIAEKLFVAPDTVKYYRRRIFDNFGVSSIVEALSYAVNSKLI